MEMSYLTGSGRTVRSAEGPQLFCWKPRGSVGPETLTGRRHVLELSLSSTTRAQRIWLQRVRIKKNQYICWEAAGEEAGAAQTLHPCVWEPRTWCSDVGGGTASPYAARSTESCASSIWLCCA